MKISRAILVFGISFALWQFYEVAGPRLIQADGYGYYDRQFEYRRNFGGGPAVYCPNNLWRKECQGYVIQPPCTGSGCYPHRTNFHQSNYYYGGGHGGHGGGGSNVFILDLFGWIPRLFHGWDEKKEVRVTHRTESDGNCCAPHGAQKSHISSDQERRREPEQAREQPAPRPHHFRKPGIYISGGSAEVRAAVEKEVLERGIVVVMDRRHAGRELKIRDQVYGDPWIRIDLQLTNLETSELIGSSDGERQFRSKNTAEKFAAIREAAASAVNGLGL